MMMLYFFILVLIVGGDFSNESNLKSFVLLCAVVVLAPNFINILLLPGGSSDFILFYFGVLDVPSGAFV
jgi:hypothetical protein